MGDDREEMLGGRVTVRRLPFIEPPFHDGGRLLTDAGELAQIANDREIRLLAFVEFSAGTTRGQHVHPERAESLYVLRGELDATFYLPDGGGVVRRRLQKGALADLGPGIGHTYVAREHTLTIEFSDRPFDEGGTLDCSPPPGEPGTG